MGLKVLSYFVVHYLFFLNSNHYDSLRLFFYTESSYFDVKSTILLQKIVINLITNLINRFPLTPLIFLKFYKFLIPSIVQFKFNFKNTKNNSQLE
jgi:hypothetical protein